MSRGKEWKQAESKYSGVRSVILIVNQTVSPNRSGTMYDVCERLVPVHTLRKATGIA